MKSISKIIKELEDTAEQLQLSPDSLTVSVLVYQADAAAMRTGQLRIPFGDVLAALKSINKKLSKKK